MPEMHAGLVGIAVYFLFRGTEGYSDFQKYSMAAGAAAVAYVVMSDKDAEENAIRKHARQEAYSNMLSESSPQPIHA